MAHTNIEPSSPETADVPQRSRNARAQARHRAKRKAYIEKLEENVAKLQAVLGLSSEQVSELPPAAVLTNRYAELEMENQRLHEQLRSLQLALHNMRYNPNVGHNGARWSPDSPTVSEFSQGPVGMNMDDPNSLRGAKKRKISFDGDAPGAYLNGHSHPANGEMTNGLASRAHFPHGSVSHATTRGRSADTSAIPFSNTNAYGQQANGSNPSEQMGGSVAIKSEPPFGEMTILSPTMAAASPISMQRAQGHQRRTSIPINVNMNHPSQVQGQVPYRMSFSPSEREYQQQQQQQSAHHHDPTYSGIVGNASRSIFGSDDENFMPSHPSPMDSRGYSGDHHQQQYLAHERLASIAERGTTTTPATNQNGPAHAHHQNGQFATPLVPNRPTVPSFPLQLQTSVGAFSAGGGMTSSPIGAGPGGDWATAMASKRA